MDAYLDEMRQGIDVEAGQTLTFGDGILHKLPKGQLSKLTLAMPCLKKIWISFWLK